MINITKIGLQTNMSNLSTINFSSIPQSATDILIQAPINANVNSGHWMTILVLVALWVISFLSFSDRTNFSEFKYGDVKALNLALGVCSLFGITMLEIGFFSNMRHVIMIVILFMITWIINLAFENKE